MRKFMALALSVLLVAASFVGIVASAADPASLTVSASSPETVAAGQTYDLTVKIDSMPTLESGHVSSIMFKVGFDKSLVSVAITSGKAADFSTTLDSGLDNIVSVEDGYIDASFMDFSFGDKFAAGKTVTFHFTVNSSAPAGTEINFDVYDVKYTVGVAMTSFIGGDAVDCKSTIPTNAKQPNLSSLWNCFKADGFTLVNSSNGVFQTGGVADTSSYKYQGYCDGQFLYVAIVTLYDPIGTTEYYGNGKGTNVRLWFRTNNAASVYTHFADISFTGDNSVPVLGGKKNTSLTSNVPGDPISTTGIVVESVAEEGYWFLQYKLPLANIDAKSTFQCYVNVSNGADTDKGILNDALLYPAVPLVDGDRLANFPYKKWNESAIVVPLKGVTASSNEMTFESANLYKLTDGEYADGATAFGDARLVGFNWAAYSYEAGAQNGTHQFSVVLDLVSLKGITGIKIGAYKDLNSFVNLPDSTKIYFSNDGVNYIAQAVGSWASTVDGLVAATERTSGLLGACTYTANWNTRAAIEARYVKLVFTISDPWVFLSEIEAITSDSNIHPVDQVALAGVDCKIEAEAVVVLTSAAGTISLNADATGDYAYARAGVLTWAKWDSAKAAYVVYKNEVNPWPNTREGFVSVDPDDILIASVSNGAIPAVGAGDKWVMRNIEVGTELHVYDNVITIGKTLSGATQRVFVTSNPGTSSEESSSQTSEDSSAQTSEETSVQTSEESSEENSEAVSEDNSSAEPEGGYDFLSSASDVKINEPVTGESVRIFTTNEALANGNTKWSINLLLKKVGDNLYEVVSVAAGNGTDYEGTLGEGEILLAVHSLSSNPEDIGTCQNVYGKLAALALVPGDKLTIEGIDEGEITKLEVYAEASSESSAETSAETSADLPDTSDAGFIALGVIAAIAAAGVLIVKKVR